jgi:hypothetical protein
MANDKIFATSIKELFTQVLPGFAAHPHAAEARGVLKFELSGTGGGTWRVTFPELSAAEGDGKADTFWKGGAQDFLNYMNGNVARWQLEEEGRPFEWGGDATLMDHFKHVLRTHRRSKGPRPLM